MIVDFNALAERFGLANVINHGSGRRLANHALARVGTAALLHTYKHNASSHGTAAPLLQKSSLTQQRKRQDE